VGLTLLLLLLLPLILLLLFVYVDARGSNEPLVFDSATTATIRKSKSRKDRVIVADKARRALLRIAFDSLDVITSRI